jgi:hypothetical protein
MRTNLLLICLFGTILASLSLPAQSDLDKPSHELRAYVQQPSGDIVPVPREYAASGLQSEGINPQANSRNTAEMLWLPGAQAAVRLQEHDAIKVWAELPQGTDIRSIELLKFETRGKRRVTYTSAFRRGDQGHWNTVAFKARQNKQGKWLIEPAVQLPPGEYCLTPRSSIDQFCFGVDKK